MNILLAGGSGFLGTELKKYFKASGHQVSVLSRKPGQEEIGWDGKTLGDWIRVIEGADVLLNLSGKSVDCRYTAKNKAQILSSRIEPTHVLHEAILAAARKPKLWINASSATIYIHAETELMTEDTGRVGDDFSMNICKSWELEFFAKTYPEMRQVALRTSIVLGNGGGAFPKLKGVTKVGLGSRQGRGNQMVSWIHIADFCAAVQFVIDHDELDGAVNITSPHPIGNETLMKALRKKYRMPFGISQPVALLEIGAMILGTETELLLKSRKVYPGKLMQSGFQFSYPKIEDALRFLK